MRAWLLGATTDWPIPESFNQMAESISDQVGHLERMSAVQQQFVSAVSHELRSPVTTIRMAGQLIYDKREELPPALRRSAELQHGQLINLDTMLSDLLEISDSMPGAMVLATERADLAKIVHTVVESQEPLAESNGVSVHIRTDEQYVALFFFVQLRIVALEGYLSSNYGLPIVFDEVSAATFKDTTGLLYSLAEGQGQQRSNIDGNVKALKNWGTSVISTAEHSVLNNSARNDGLNVRTIEISEAFTTSADNADAIKRATSVNYGHIMPLVAEYLLKREDEVIKWFHAEHEFIQKPTKK